jgi:hypothetical protein
MLLPFSPSKKNQEYYLGFCCQGRFKNDMLRLGHEGDDGDGVENEDEV